MQYNNVLKDWLARRKISESVSTDFNIYWGSCKFFGECIVIPIKDQNGNFIFNKYRRNPLIDEKPKYIYDTGSKMSLYGIDKIGDAKTILITEGEMDCLVAISANITAVSSTGGSMSFHEEWAELLKDREVIICYDNDEAGGKGMVHTLNILPNAKILFLPDRPGIKDISDYVASGGDLNTLIKSAKHFKGLDEVIEDRSDRIALWQSVHFHDAYIANHKEPENDTPEKIKNNAKHDNTLLDRAKAYPISSLIHFTKGKAKCLWHNERTGSMTYFKDTNKVYCFGCAKKADSVDVYMQLHNCSFLEAVKALQ